MDYKIVQPEDFIGPPPDFHRTGNQRHCRLIALLSLTFDISGETVMAQKKSDDSTEAFYFSG